jgi:hypothetical protein
MLRSVFNSDVSEAICLSGETALTWQAEIEFRHVILNNAVSDTGH